jgi:tetratricopeptide (TPR) repeat protein
VASEARTETSAPAAGADGASGTRPGAGGSGSRESALASARSAVAGDSSGSRAALARARRLLSEGRGDLAEPLLRRVAGGAGPGRRRAQAWTLLGDLAQRSGRLEEAARAYGRAAALGRGSMVGPNAIYALARLQERRLRDVGAARRSYARYLTEAPDGPLAPQARRALCRLGDEARCEGAR